MKLGATPQKREKIILKSRIDGSVWNAQSARAKNTAKIALNLTLTMTHANFASRPDKTKAHASEMDDRERTKIQFG